MPSIRAGAAKAVVTPPIGYTMGAWGLRQGRSTGVHRHLNARALVIDNGAETLAVVAMDVAGIPVDVLKLIRSRAERLCGIGPDRLLISSTHNHTTPDFISGIPPELGVYASIFAETVAGVVFEAFNRLAPARIGHGAGRLDGWTVNRQYPESPIDTSVGVLRVDTASGAPVARVVNFACHGVCDGGQYLSWSGDFPGAMSAKLEEWVPGSVGIYLQGAAGDIHPFDWWFGNWKSKHMHTHVDTESFGTALAAEAVRVAESSGTSRSASLSAATSTVALPRRRVSWSIKQAESNHTSLKKKLGAYHGDTWPAGTTTAIAAMKVPALYGTGANELRLAQNQTKPALPVSLNAFRIGDLLISSGPGELFNELGRQVKDGAGQGGAWVASYCDDYIGYISTRKPHEAIAGIPLDEIVDQDRYRKYYGTTTSPYSPEAGEALAEASIKLLGKL